MADRGRQPSRPAPGRLVREGPEAALGTLARDIAARATLTSAGATGATLVARAMGTRAPASTVGMTAVVGTWLGRTILIGGRDPVVLAAGLGSADPGPGSSRRRACRTPSAAVRSGRSDGPSAPRPPSLRRPAPPSYREPRRPGRSAARASPDRSVMATDVGCVSPRSYCPNRSSRRGPEPDYVVELSAAGRASPGTTALATPPTPTTLAPTSPIPARATAPANGRKARGTRDASRSGRSHSRRPMTTDVRRQEVS